MTEQSNEVILTEVERAKALTKELTRLLSSDSFRQALIEEFIKLVPSLEDVTGNDDNISSTMENILINSFISSEIISPISKTL